MYYDYIRECPCSDETLMGVFKDGGAWCLPLWEDSRGRNIHMHRHTLLCSVAQSSLTLCDPVDCGLPGSSVHGIFQARILRWVAMPCSRAHLLGKCQIKWEKGEKRRNWCGDTSSYFQNLVLPHGTQCHKCFFHFCLLPASFLLLGSHWARFWERSFHTISFPLFSFEWQMKVPLNRTPCCRIPLFDSLILGWTGSIGCEGGQNS